MRETLVGTRLGRRLESARNRLALAQTFLANPEQAGMQINDQLATWLTYRLCRKDKVFIDVGAHIGSVSAGASAWSSPRKIIAIEAMPAKAANLRRRFPRLAVLETAVGDSTGPATFYVDNERSGFSSLIPGAGGRGSASTSEIAVNMSKLDDIVDDPDVDLIKIDVEGAEAGVIRGAQRLLEACRPIVMFESGPPPANATGYSKDELWDALSRLDYMIVVPDRLPHSDNGLCRDGFIEAHAYPRRATNYFAVPKEERNAVRDRARAILGK